MRNRRFTLDSSLLTDYDRFVRAAIGYYWAGKNAQTAFAERNLTFHFARALAERGFQIYTEVPRQPDSTEKVDCIAFHPNTGVLLVIESKRLFDAGQAASLARDVKRIEEFHLDPHLAASEMLVREAHGVLLACSWQPSVVEKWREAFTPVEGSAGGWSLLRKKLVNIESHVLTCTPMDVWQPWLFVGSFPLPVQEEFKHARRAG